MYNLNDTILYGTQGVCTVTEIVSKKIQGNEQEYYLLRPVYDSRSTIFAPCNSAVTESKMRELSTNEEIDAIISDVSKAPAAWIDDANSRRERFSAALHSGDSREILKLAKTLFLRREKLAKQGKNLSGFDTRFLKEAEKVVFEEFAYVLNLSPSEIHDYIFKKNGLETPA